MYWALRGDYEIDENGGYYSIDDGLELEGVESWALGAPFSGPLPEPIVVAIRALDGFRGAPPEMNDGNMLLCSARLVDVLREAGVTNLACYPAVLRDEENAREFRYFAVNVLGLVAAADLARSKWENLDGEARMDTHFERLAVDEGALAGVLMCRLAESTGTIVVHDRVKVACERARIPRLVFRRV